MFLWMELHLVSLKGSAMSNSEFWSVYGFDMAFGSLSFNAQAMFLLCWRNRGEGDDRGRDGWMASPTQWT